MVFQNDDECFACITLREKRNIRILITNIRINRKMCSIGEAL